MNDILLFFFVFIGIDLVKLPSCIAFKGNKLVKSVSTKLVVIRIFGHILSGLLLISVSNILFYFNVPLLMLEKEPFSVEVYLYLILSILIIQIIINKIKLSLIKMANKNKYFIISAKETASIQTLIEEDKIIYQPINSKNATQIISILDNRLPLVNRINKKFKNKSLDILVFSFLYLLILPKTEDRTLNKNIELYKTSIESKIEDSFSPWKF